MHYVPKFTATTTLGNSTIMDVSGNVGIGITPVGGYTLEVNGPTWIRSGWLTVRGASYGVLVDTTTTAGIYIPYSQNTGIVVGNADYYGIDALGTRGNHLYSNSSSYYGLTVHSLGSVAGNKGLSVKGTADITGTVTKGGGSFKIDHPLDPENKYLYHSFVESPDMMNIYNGNATLDSSGEAWVELPEWFEALNRDFRYQLTCIGGFAPVYVAQEVSGNQFKIGGGEPGMKVSWQVTGIRHDPFAEMYRIPVEQQKIGPEIGKYQHPETYGQPITMGVHCESREAQDTPEYDAQ